MTLPTTSSAIAAGTPADHAAWHNEINGLIPSLGLPTVTTSTTSGHLAAHEALHAFVGGATGTLPLDVNDNDPGHLGHHLPIHQYLSGTTVTNLTTASNIQTALTAGATGAVFLLAAGTYRPTTNYTATTGIVPKQDQTVYFAYGAVLSGAAVLSSWTTSGSDFFATRASGTAAAAAPDNPGDGNRCAITGCENRHDVFYDGAPLVRVASQAALGTGKFWEDFTNNRVYIRDTPTGHTVEQAVATFLVHPTASGVKVRNGTLQMAANAAQVAAVEMDGANGLVEACEVRYNHGHAIGSNGNNTVVRRNKIHHQMQMGAGGEGDDCLWEYNEINHNNRDGSYDAGWEAGGTKWALCDRLTLRGNWSHHNKGIGLWCDINLGAVVYEDNYVNDNDLWGIFYEIAYGEVTSGDGLKTHIRRNICDNNGTFNGSQGFWDTGQIVVSASRDVEVYQNTVRGWDGIGCTAQLRTDHTDARGAHQVRNVHVYDNDIESTYTSGLDGWGNAAGIKTDDTVNQDPEVWTTQGNQFGGSAGAGNRYYVPSSTYQHWTWRADLGTNFATWAQWQGYGQDTNGTRTVGGHVTIPAAPTLNAGPRGPL